MRCHSLCQTKLLRHPLRPVWLYVAIHTTVVDSANCSSSSYSVYSAAPCVLEHARQLLADFLQDFLDEEADVFLQAYPAQRFFPTWQDRASAFLTQVHQTHFYG